jgi:hypothetical protein
MKKGGKCMCDRGRGRSGAGDEEGGRMVRSRSGKVEGN